MSANAALDLREMAQAASETTKLLLGCADVQFRSRFGCRPQARVDNRESKSGLQALGRAGDPLTIHELPGSAPQIIVGNVDPHGVVHRFEQALVFDKVSDFEARALRLDAAASDRRRYLRARTNRLRIGPARFTMQC